MRQVFQKSYLSKELCVEDVPAPMLAGPGVLVHNAASLISPGTERATVSFARKGLIAKVRSQPERVKLLLRKMKQVGVTETVQLAKRKLENPIPLGYSTAGQVLETSLDMPGIKAGDRVACAGARYANHADVVFIPKNLCVPLPDNLSYEEGAFVAPGAIALHGVRLAETGLGETVLVIGLGLIGQLAAQLARAQGANVIGIDLDQSRLQLARDLGMNHAFHRNDAALQSAILELTGGRGADAVLIAAATPSDDPVYLAGELCRERGKVVVVGDVGMQIPRNTYYHKELSVIVSRSYGPGRYDEDYELHGRDYPAAYVRWTERDNMSTFLQLASEGKVSLKPLIQERFPVEEAARAYDLLTGKQAQPLGIILTYPQPQAGALPVRKLVLIPRTPSLSGKIGLSVIGTGSFLTGTLLGILKRQKALSLRGAISHTGLSAKNVGALGSFAYCATDPAEAWMDADTKAVLISTRHDSHADLVARALEAGKHVFVEKPLAVNRAELAQCVEAVGRHPKQQLMVGFNRRFAPLSAELKRQLDTSPAARPLSIHYRVLAGHIPEDHWVHQNGGRIVGEVCHFIDWCHFITGEPAVEVAADAVGKGLNQDVSIRIRFSGGSVAHIEYLMRPDMATVAALGKEHIRVTTHGLLAEIEDFKRLRLVREGKSGIRKTGKADKGHAGEITAFVEALQTGQPAIPPQEIFLTTEATLAVMDSLRTRMPVPISPPG